MVCPYVACQMFKMPMSHVSVAKEWPCPLSILNYEFKASCCVTKPSCCMSNIRKGHVAMSNLVVQTHSTLINLDINVCFEALFFSLYYFFLFGGGGGGGG